MATNTRGEFCVSAETNRLIQELNPQNPIFASPGSELRIALYAARFAQKIPLGISDDTGCRYPSVGVDSGQFKAPAPKPSQTCIAKDAPAQTNPAPKEASTVPVDQHAAGEVLEKPVNIRASEALCRQNKTIL